MDDRPVELDLPPQIRQLRIEGGALTIGDQRWIVHLESAAVVVNQTGPAAHELHLRLSGPYGRTRRACVWLDTKVADEGDRMRRVFKALEEWLPNSDASDIFSRRF
jgi:hypothetical protein